MSHSCLYVNEYIDAHHPDSGIECLYEENKGKYLQSHLDVTPGSLVFSEPTLHLVQKPSTDCEVYTILENLCNTHQFPLDPFWYWCALNSVILKKNDTSLESSPIPFCTIEKITLDRILALYHPSSSTIGIEVPMLMNLFNLEIYGVSDVLLESVLQIWAFNCFDIAEDCYALFFLPSFFSHSCLPNSIWALEPCLESDANSKKFNLNLIARMRIRAGDEITISYLSEEVLLEPAFLRRKELLATKYFVCQCKRCTAPVDLSRGFLCEQCRMGTYYLHPEVTINTFRQYPYQSQLKSFSIPPIQPACKTLEIFHSILHDTLFKPFITTIPNAIDDPLIYESWLTCFEALRCSTCGHILSDESYETIVTLENMTFSHLDQYRSSPSKQHEILDFLKQHSYFFKYHWIALKYGFLFETNSETTTSLMQYQRALEKLCRIKIMLNIPNACLVWAYDELFEAYCIYIWKSHKPIHDVSQCFALHSFRTYSSDLKWLPLLILSLQGHLYLFGYKEECTQKVLTKIHRIKEALYELMEFDENKFVTYFPDFYKFLQCLSCEKLTYNILTTEFHL